MGIVQSLSLLALRQVALGASRAAGIVGIEAVARFLGDHFTDHSRRLSQALQNSSVRAWNSLEIALAGESVWNRLDEADDRAFRAQVRSFLEAASVDALGGQGDTFRQECLRELRAVRKSGLLQKDTFDPADLARQAAELAGHGDAAQLIDREWQALDRAADVLRGSGHPALARLVGLRPGEGKVPLLVLGVRFYFRKAVEADAELHRALSFVQWQSLADGQQRGFEQLGRVLDVQGQHLTTLLDEVGEVKGAVLDLSKEIAGQREQIQQLARDVLQVLGQHQLERRELRVGDSLSIRTDEERRLVRNLVARYRELPPEQRRQMPALLNAVGKMEVVTGNFEEARRDFEELVRIIPAQKERAEAHHNAYQAALECRRWDEALTALRQAVALDPERFAPFPLTKYEPERILGAGGFGVAFLCKDCHTGSRVVVKALRADGLDRPVSEVFAEARALEELDHRNIVRLRHCDYAGGNNTRPYLVMDYFEGVPLADHVAQHGPLSPPEAAALLSQVALALHRAHEKNICHRDVKPGNILVKRQGASGESASWDVKLIDFGLALRQQTVQTTLGAASSYNQTLVGSSIAGTLDYAAPEQLGKRPGEKVGPHSDVYGLGKTACYALFGTTMPLARHWRGVEPELADLLGQCLAEDPRERPASCKEVAERLTQPGELHPQRVPVSTPGATPQPGQEEQAQPVARDPRRPFWVGGLLAALPTFLIVSFKVHAPFLASSFPILLGAALASGCGAVCGRRWARLGVRERVIIPLILLFFPGIPLMLLAAAPYHGRPDLFLALGFFVLIVPGVLGSIWGRSLGQVAAPMIVLPLVIVYSLAAPGWAVMFFGALLGATLAAGMEVADPLREGDSRVDRFLVAGLEFLNRVLPGRAAPSASASASPPAMTLPVSASSEPGPESKPPSRLELAIRLPLILAACGFTGLAMGTNAGAVALGTNVWWQSTLTILLVLGGLSAALAILLTRVQRFGTMLFWLIGSGVIGAGLGGLLGGLAWEWVGGPAVMAVGLIVLAATLGMLGGLRLGYPILGTISGAILGGALTLGGILLAHPDTGGLLGLALGLVGGTLLWSGLRPMTLWLSRAGALTLVVVALTLTVVFRAEWGTPATVLGERQGTSIADAPWYKMDGKEGRVLVRGSEGNRLALLNRGVLEVWNPSTGRHIDTFSRSTDRILTVGIHQERVRCLLLSVNYTYGTQRESLYQARLVDPESGSTVGPAAWKVENAVAAASDGETFLLVESYFSSVPGTQEKRHRLHFVRHDGSGPWTYELKESRAVTAAVLKGDMVLLGFDSGSIVQLERKPDETLAVKQETTKYGEPIHSMGLSPSGRMLWALGGRSFFPSSLLCGNVADWKDFYQIQPGSLPLSAAFTADDRTLLIGTQRGTVEAWNVEQRTRQRKYRLLESVLADSLSHHITHVVAEGKGMTALAAERDGYRRGLLFRWTLEPERPGILGGGSKVIKNNPRDEVKPDDRQLKPWEKLPQRKTGDGKDRGPGEISREKSPGPKEK